MPEEDIYDKLRAECAAAKATLVAVSKTKPEAAIMDLYARGQRDFGENYVQELIGKYEALPKDIRWHFIGHLQSNKVKQIVPFVHLIHGVDRFKLLQAIDKQCAQIGRVQDVLLQLYTGGEETKFGMDTTEMMECLNRAEQAEPSLKNIRIRGIMAMAAFTEDEAQIHAEFSTARAAFDNFKKMFFIGKPYFDTCSMGMSGDYTIALAEGSNMLRIGSKLFGARNYAQQQ